MLDLRSSGWVPRREENVPKKISEVHADAASKEFEDDFSITGFTLSPRPGTNIPSTQPSSGTYSSSPQLTGEYLSKSPSSTSTISAPATTKPASKPKKKKDSKSKSKSDTLTISEPVFFASPQEYEEKVTDILKEFLQSNDTKEVVTALRELDFPEYRFKVIEAGITLTLEKGDKDRQAMSKLFTILSKEGLLNESNFVKG